MSCFPLRTAVTPVIGFLRRLLLISALQCDSWTCKSPRGVNRAGYEFIEPKSILRRILGVVNTARKLSKSCPTRCERSNRPAAANRAEETMGGFVVAKWRAAPLKTDQAMVRNARV